MTAELTANHTAAASRAGSLDLLNRLGRETADPNEIPPDLDAVTVINDWRLVGIRHRNHAEQELAMAIAERHRTPPPRERGTEMTRTDPAVIDTTLLTYTVDEVAHLLNLSRGITYQYVRDGMIPAERLGRRWLVPRETFHAWLDGQNEVA